MNGIGGKGKTSFHVKRSFPLPPEPPFPFQEKRGIITLSHPHSQSERFMFAAGKRFTLRSNASRRIFPALHVGLHRKPTQLYHILTREASASCLPQANASHCEAMLHAGFFLRFTLVCTANQHPLPLRCRGTCQSDLQIVVRSDSCIEIVNSSFLFLTSLPQTAIRVAKCVNITKSGC